VVSPLIYLGQILAMQRPLLAVERDLAGQWIKMVGRTLQSETYKYRIKQSNKTNQQT